MKNEKNTPLWRKVFQFAGMLLPHALFILGMLILTLLIADYFNPAMSFINNRITKYGMTAFCIFAIAEGIGRIADGNRKEK